MTAFDKRKAVMVIVKSHSQEVYSSTFARFESQIM